MLLRIERPEAMHELFELCRTTIATRYSVLIGVGFANCHETAK